MELTQTPATQTQATNQPLRQISVVIIAQDEEDCISTAIQSCQTFADEIVVIDGGSQDATVEIAENLGCKVQANPWPGYAKQRNFGAQQASHDWIFMLDADEFVDQKLAIALSNWKQAQQLTANAFSVERVGDFLGQWLDSKPETHIRLYNKAAIQIKDVLVHETPDVGDEPIIKLTGRVWHAGFRSISELAERFNKYTDLDAKKAYEEGKKFSLIRLLLKPHAKFIQVYLWQGHCWKGLVGLFVAGLWSYYIFLKEVKLYELILTAKQNPQSF